MRRSVIIVDTSVWIDYFRGSNTALASTLDGLLDEDRVVLVPPVRLELLLGCRKSQRVRLLRLLEAIPTLPATEGAWKAAERLSLELREDGVTAGVVDLLIAALAFEHAASLWTLDKDFDPLFKTQRLEAFLF